MRSILYCLVILLHCANALGRDRVTVGKPIVSLVGTQQRLREWCAAEGRFDACTRFVAFRLHGSCASSEGAWRIEGTATFLPLILLRNMRSLSHEHEHIDDVRRSVELHLVALEELRFPSGEACRARTATETGAFGSTMQAFALDSNLARHPALRVQHERRSSNQ